MADPIQNPDAFLSSLGQINSNIGATPNPWFTTANQFLPRNLHDVIRWSRYITIHSPTVTEVIRKLCTYPITDFLIESEDDKLKQRYKEIFASFKLKQTLQDIGFDYFTLGNVFISVYFPIHRILTCPSCNVSYSARKASFLTFKKYEFEGICPKCSTRGIFKRTDSKSQNIDDMNIIKWNPENIAVAHNSITGESEYYYRVPNDIKKKIMMGDRLYVDTVPWGFIDAVKNNQDFKFDPANIFHLRNLSTGAIVEGCSIPPLISLYSLVFYQATLRKANESIATEHMAPLRVVFPQPGSSNSDPVVNMSLKNFVNNMQNAIKLHKRDNNYFLVAPGPIGYEAIGGEGKNLLVSQEIEQAEESILMSLGVSKELLSGTTNWTSSTVGLRLLDNTLSGYTIQILNVIDWIVRKFTAYLNMTPVKVGMIPFKLADDETLKTNLVQMSGSNACSPTTLYESLGLDYRDELKRMKDDAIAKAVLDVEIQFEVDQAVFLAGKKAGDKLDNNTDYQAILAQSQQITTELQGQDPGTMQSALDDLKLQNYPLYVMVNKTLKDRVAEAPMITSSEQGMAAEAQAAAGLEAGVGAGSDQGGSDSSKSSKSDKPSKSKGSK